MEAVAKLRNYRMSERKVRLVADLVRNKPIDEALNILRFNKKAASKPMEKLLMSAIANWEYKLDLMESADDYDLILREIYVDGGSSLKRFRPAAYGRAHPIRKRTCHITMKIENTVPLPDEESESVENLEQDVETENTQEDSKE